MSRLTVDERRRANELRTREIQRRVPRAVAHVDAGARGWEKGARRAAAIGIGLAATFAVFQFIQQLAVYGPGTLLDLLLPRV
jgi:hypothetical protein